MSANDLVLLNQNFQEWKAAAPAGLSNDKLFEVFATEQVLKDHHLTFDDLLCGCIGGSDDGGLDAFFPFLNGVLLEEDSDLERVGREPELVLYVGQMKETGSFQEVVFQKATPTLRQLLDLTVDEADLRALYSSTLVDRAMVFRAKLRELAARHPRISVHFVYATDLPPFSVPRIITVPPPPSA